MPAFQHRGVRVTVSDGAVSIYASPAATYAWAHRTGERWPCSTLSGHTVFLLYVPAGLADIAVQDPDTGALIESVPAHEVSAFASDVAAPYLDEAHALHPVVVGDRDACRGGRCVR